MTRPGLLMRSHNIQTVNTPWYTEWGFTVFILYKKFWNGVGDYKGEGRSPFILFNFKVIIGFIYVFFLNINKHIFL